MPPGGYDCIRNQRNLFIYREQSAHYVGTCKYIYLLSREYIPVEISSCTNNSYASYSEKDVWNPYAIFKDDVTAWTDGKIATTPKPFQIVVYFIPDMWLTLIRTRLTLDSGYWYTFTWIKKNDLTWLFSRFSSFGFIVPDKDLKLSQKILIFW